jgi:hypothetical protein
MQHYYFNLTDGRRQYPDPLGTHLPDMQAARRHAFEDARSLLESWMARSLIPWRIDVRDDAGGLVCSIALAEAAVSEARPLFHHEDEADEPVAPLLEASFLINARSSGTGD